MAFAVSMCCARVGWVRKACSVWLALSDHWFLPSPGGSLPFDAAPVVGGALGKGPPLLKSHSSSRGPFSCGERSRFLRRHHHMKKQSSKQIRTAAPPMMPSNIGKGKPDALWPLVGSCPTAPVVMGTRGGGGGGGGGHGGGDGGGRTGGGGG